MGIGAHNGNNKDLKQCKGGPRDRRDLLNGLFLLKPTNNVDFAELIGQPKLNLTHLQPAFLGLFIGYLASFLAFIGELSSGKITASSNLL